MRMPRNLFKPESPLANLSPAAQAAAAATLLSSYLADLRKIALTLDLTATIDELTSQISALEDAMFMHGQDMAHASAILGFNPALARTRMQNCLRMARVVRLCLTDTDAIDLAAVQARFEARPGSDGPPPPDDQKARRLQYLLECGREDLAREEGLL